jgi:hypothetical protein
MYRLHAFNAEDVDGFGPSSTLADLGLHGTGRVRHEEGLPISGASLNSLG